MYVAVKNINRHKKIFHGIVSNVIYIGLKRDILHKRPSIKKTFIFFECS